MPHLQPRQALFGASPAIARGLGLIAVGLGALMQGAHAQEAEIRKALAARLPQSASVDEVTPTPIPGLYEVRSGITLFYTDRHGDYLIRGGEMLDTRRQINLTEARLARFSRIDFAKLPLQDAIVTTRGKGTRKLAVFADPDCPYCKQLEATLQQRDDLTIYTFLLPVLGPGSLDKAKAIWCAKDRDAAWRDWMVEGKAPAAQPSCDTGALDRNRTFGKQHAFRATPALVYEDGTRLTGAPGAMQLEALLAQHQATTANRAKVGAP